MAIGKKEIQTRHAKKRFRQRHRVKFSSAALTEMARLVKQGKGELLEKQSRHRGLWNIRFRGGLYKVIYDSNTKAIVTVLL